MSEHSLEELKRQYEAARSRYIKTQEDMIEAGKRYTAKAMSEMMEDFASRGIVPGGRVRLITKRLDGDKHIVEAGFLGVEAGWMAGVAKPVFSRLKKDGTPSKAKWDVGCDEIELVETPIAKAADNG